MFDSSLNATFSRTRQHPQPTYSPMHNGLDFDFPRNQSSQETRVFRLKPPYRLQTNSCGLQSSLGRQLPKLDTAARKPAGTRYPHIGDSSMKFHFFDSFRTPHCSKTRVFPKYSHMWLAKAVQPLQLQVFDSSLNAMFSRTRQHPKPTHSPMHNGLDLDLQKKNRVFPQELPYRQHTHSCGLQSSLGRQLPKLDTAGRKPAGTRYPHIGDSSMKFHFFDSFYTPIAPKPEFSRKTHPCGW